MDTTIIIMVAAILGANLLSMKAPIAGAAAAVLVSLGIGVWGWTVMNKGGQIGFFTGQKLSPTVFYVFIAALSLVNGMQLLRAIKARH